jgi:hypothetical protein
MPAAAQESFKPFGGLAVGVKLSPFMGYGLELATPLSNKFILRGGVTLTNGVETPDVNINLPDTDDNLYDAFGYVPQYKAKLGAHFTHGNILVDFHPAGIFHLTAGVFIGSSTFKVEGKLVDWRAGHEGEDAVLLDPSTHSWPTIEFGNQELTLDGGKANIDLKLGDSAIKPYFGLGVGRAIAKNSRVAFKFELGVMYHGQYSLKQNGTVLDLSSSSEETVRDIHDILKLVNVWPQMNFQLSYRIF